MASQQWAGVLRADDGTEKRVEQRRFPFQADHLNQVGWWDWAELRWWSPLEIWRGSVGFERRVRELYFSIAEEVTAADP